MDSAEFTASSAAFIYHPDAIRASNEAARAVPGRRQKQAKGPPKGTLQKGSPSKGTPSKNTLSKSSPPKGSPNKGRQAAASQQQQQQQAKSVKNVKPTPQKKAAPSIFSPTGPVRSGPQGGKGQQQARGQRGSPQKGRQVRSTFITGLRILYVLSYVRTHLSVLNHAYSVWTLKRLSSFTCPHRLHRRSSRGRGSSRPRGRRRGLGRRPSHSSSNRRSSRSSRHMRGAREARAARVATAAPTRRSQRTQQALAVVATMVGVGEAQRRLRGEGRVGRAERGLR